MSNGVYFGVENKKEIDSLNLRVDSSATKDELAVVSGKVDALGAFKQKKVTGIYTGGVDVSLPHGLNANKIVSITYQVVNSIGDLVSPDLAQDGYAFTAYTSFEACVFRKNPLFTDTNIAGGAATAFITYEDSQMLEGV